MKLFKRKKEVEPEEIPEVKIYQKPKVKEVEVQEEPKETIGMAKIIGAELLEKGFRYVVISNKRIGDIGEEFPIE